MFESILFVCVGALLGAVLPTLFVRTKSDKNVEDMQDKAMDKIYRELLKKRQSSDFRYSPEVRRVIDRVHAEQMLK